MNFLFKSSFVVVLLLCLGLAYGFYSQRERPNELTANQLAEVMGVHWWTVVIPTDLGPKDMITTELISSDGKVVAEGSGQSSGPTGWKFGDRVRVYCWEDKGGQKTNITLVTNSGAGTCFWKDYFKDSATSGPNNGSVLKAGDILLKFDPTSTPSYIGGNVLQPGQFGLRVVIKRG